MKSKHLSSILVILSFLVSGCVESSFTLAQESRPPRWFSLLEGEPKNKFKVTLDYHTNGTVVFKLYRKDSFFPIEKISGVTRGREPLKLKNPPDGFPKHYPLYEVILIEGQADIVEHRKMEPVFYMTDDPAIWNEFGVLETK